MLLDDYKGEQLGAIAKEGAGEFWKDFNPGYQSEARMGSRSKELEHPGRESFSESKLIDLLNSLFENT